MTLASPRSRLMPQLVLQGLDAAGEGGDGSFEVGHRASLWRIGYRSPLGRSATGRTFPRQPGRGRGGGMVRIIGSFVDRVLALPSLQKLRPFEDRCVRTPIAQHRAVLAELGAPLLAETYGTTSPRRGMMRI